jgi:site-specific DNA recombinase
MAYAPSLPPQPAQRAAIYVRVSTSGQEESGYSLGGQVADCRKLGDTIGAGVVAAFQDVGSGTDWELPGLNAMLDAAKRRDFDVLLCYDMDRLSRNLAKQLFIEEELKRAGVSVRYVTMPVGESDEDELLKNVRSVIAQYERGKIRRRLTKGKRDKAELGQVVGIGCAPFGYRYVRQMVKHKERTVGLEPDPVTAPIVRRIVAELRTRPVEQVCRRLTAEGVPRPGRTERWAQSTIINILRNPVYVGHYVYGRRAYGSRRGKQRPWQWRETSDLPSVRIPALLTSADVEAALEAMAERKRHHTRRRTPADDPYTLRGLLTCALCDGPLACMTSGSEQVRYYTCLRRHPGRARMQNRERCAMVGIPARALEEHTWRLVTGTLLDPAYLREGLAEARKADEASGRRLDRLAFLSAQIEKCRRRLERITIERLDAEPGSEAELTLQAADTATKAEITAFRAELTELEARPAEGLTEDAAAAIEQFAAEITAGIDAASQADRRRAYELLRLRGRVALDAERGVKLGRRHRFSTDWRALVELRNEQPCITKLGVSSRAAATAYAFRHQLVDTTAG